jgi:hypothetical protein
VATLAELVANTWYDALDQASYIVDKGIPKKFHPAISRDDFLAIDRPNSNDKPFEAVVRLRGSNVAATPSTIELRIKHVDPRAWIIRWSAEAANARGVWVCCVAERYAP